MNISAKDFATQVLQSANPVLVDFYGEHCMPCKLLMPILQELAQEQANLSVCYFSTDISPTETQADIDAKFAVLGEYGVMSLPTLLLFKHGKAVASQVGFMTKEQLLQWLAEHDAL